jgi:hypothetical protein
VRREPDVGQQFLEPIRGMGRQEVLAGDAEGVEDRRLPTNLPYGDLRMDASLKLKAEQFAGDLAHEAKTLEDLNELLRSLAKSALERMLECCSSPEL